jgi:transcriptional regulator with XRE-family HTH domain
VLSERLKLARTAAGLSLRGLQQKIDNLVTAQAIGKYERNEAMPGSRVLIALARALDVSEDYLVGDREVVLEKVEFRKKSIASRKEEAQVEAKALHLLERYLLVEELLGLPSVDWDQPREAPYPVQEIPEADRAARSLSQHWGLGIDPIPNLVELLEERGIKVLGVDLAEAVDGLTARARRVGKAAAPVIVLNRRRAGERQRFTLAHELGHMAIQAGGSVDAEKAAHRFAGAFLMPVEALWAEVGKHRRSIGWSELFDLKQLFGVSVQAITAVSGTAPHTC